MTPYLTQTSSLKNLDLIQGQYSALIRTLSLLAELGPLYAPLDTRQGQLLDRKLFNMVDKILKNGATPLYLKNVFDLINKGASVHSIAPNGKTVLTMAWEAKPLLTEAESKPLLYPIRQAERIRTGKRVEPLPSWTSDRTASSTTDVQNQTKLKTRKPTS